MYIKNKPQRDKHRSISPDQILSFSDQADSSDVEKKLQMRIKGLDPLKYLELKVIIKVKIRKILRVQGKSI